MEGRPATARLSQKPPASRAALNEYQWECPYCKGVGIDPDNPTGIKNCPACHGRIFWQAEMKSSEMEICGNCGGSGRSCGRDEVEGCGQVCPVCQGAGRL